jgi:nucleoside-diphosphate-sugar epimerase
MSFPFRRLFIAGHSGMVGASVCRLMQSQHPEVDLVLRSRQDLDLTEASQVDRFFQETKPDAVIFAAAKVGGILANASFPVEFLSENVRMAINAIESAHRSGVQRFLFLGSTCIYPKHAPQPLREPSLLSSPLESTNEAYALAKIVGLKLCQYYRTQFKAVYHSAMPTNLYGPGDNYDPNGSHVLPALLRRFENARIEGAKEITLWGTGVALREFLHVDDMAAASLYVLELPHKQYEANTQPMLSHINVGCGEDVSILELAQLVASVTGYQGRIVTDPSKPDGTMRKLMDVSRLASMGWEAQIGLKEGVQDTYHWYLKNIDTARA